MLFYLASSLDQTFSGQAPLESKRENHSLLFDDIKILLFLLLCVLQEQIGLQPLCYRINFMAWKYSFTVITEKNRKLYFWRFILTKVQWLWLAYWCWPALKFIFMFSMLLIVKLNFSWFISLFNYQSPIEISTASRKLKFKTIWVSFGEIW